MEELGIINGKGNFIAGKVVQGQGCCTLTAVSFLQSVKASLG